MNTLLSQQFNPSKEFKKAELEELCHPQNTTHTNLKDKLKEFLQHIDENHDSEDEGIEDYNLGGYHPVHIG